MITEKFLRQFLSKKRPTEVLLNAGWYIKILIKCVTFNVFILNIYYLSVLLVLTKQ